MWRQVQADPLQDSTVIASKYDSNLGVSVTIRQSDSTGVISCFFGEICIRVFPRPCQRETFHNPRERLGKLDILHLEPEPEVIGCTFAFSSGIPSTGLNCSLGTVCVLYEQSLFAYHFNSGGFVWIPVSFLNSELKLFGSKEYLIIQEREEIHVLRDPFTHRSFEFVQCTSNEAFGKFVGVIDSPSTMLVYWNAEICRLDFVDIVISDETTADVCSPQTIIEKLEDFHLSFPQPPAIESNHIWGRLDRFKHIDVPITSRVDVIDCLSTEVSSHSLFYFIYRACDQFLFKAFVVSLNDCSISFLPHSFSAYFIFEARLPLGPLPLFACLERNSTLVLSFGDCNVFSLTSLLNQDSLTTRASQDSQDSVLIFHKDSFFRAKIFFPNIDYVFVRCLNLMSTFFGTFQMSIVQCQMTFLSTSDPYSVLYNWLSTFLRNLSVDTVQNLFLSLQCLQQTCRLFEESSTSSILTRLITDLSQIVQFSSSRESCVSPIDCLLTGTPVDSKFLICSVAVQFIAPFVFSFLSEGAARSSSLEQAFVESCRKRLKSISDDGALRHIFKKRFATSDQIKREQHFPIHLFRLSFFFNDSVFLQKLPSGLRLYVISSILNCLMDSRVSIRT